MTKEQKEAQESDGYCHDCQVIRGASMPSEGLIGITVSEGICAMCGEQTGLVPDIDYNWPDRKAVWD